MVEEKRTNQSLMNALCYVPIVAFVLYFAEEKDKKTPEYLRHMRYGMVLL
jgi:hypothetical protein